MSVQETVKVAAPLLPLQPVLAKIESLVVQLVQEYKLVEQFVVIETPCVQLLTDLPKPVALAKQLTDENVKVSLYTHLLDVMSMAHRYVQLSQVAQEEPQL